MDDIIRPSGYWAMPRNTHRRAARFGAFEVDPWTGTLRKNGARLKVQEQPFRVLSALLERPGDLVTREELREILWPDDAFVDFDNNLNTAVNKLREVLGDSASHPRFVETVPKRGYRFLPPVEGSGEPQAAQPPASPRSWKIGVTALSALLVVTVGVLLVTLMERATTRDTRVRVFTLSPEEEATTPVISPNGDHIAYITGGGDESQLWVWDLDQREPRLIPGAEGATYPFWSPDSRFIGFAAGGELRKVALAGSASTAICQLPSGREFEGGAWSADGGSIAFARLPSIYEVPARGGVPKVLIEVDPGGETDHLEYPTFLPGKGNSSLLLARKLIGKRHDLILYSRETGELTDISPPGHFGYYPTYSPSGHLVYLGGNSANGVFLWALPLSVTTIAAAGGPFPIAQNCNYPSVARDGTMVCLENSRMGGRPWQVVWRDRRGGALGSASARGIITFSLSPDGARLATKRWGQRDIWVQHLERGAQSRVHLSSGFTGHYVWSPAGDAITFAGTQRGDWDILSSPLGGPARETLLVGSALNEEPWDWSREGMFLVYTVDHPETGRDLWYLQREGGDRFEPHPFLQESGVQTRAKLSPDGRYIAYESNHSGRPEIYVRGFPKGHEVWQISESGGTRPRWRRDGKELYYVEGERLIALSVTTTPEFTVRTREILFSNPNLAVDLPEIYDVSPDGERFLVAGPAEAPRSVIRVTQNWYEAFRER